MEKTTVITPWPHQVYAREQIAALVAQGLRRILVQCPTGGGKTWIMESEIRDCLEAGQRAVLYTHRRALADQISDDFLNAGIYHGRRAQGFPDEREHRFQISMIQTEVSRVLKRAQWELHKADLVVFDEGHLHTGPGATKIRQIHYDAGATILDFSATPFGMADVCQAIVVAGTNSQLRQCGALVPARTFGPDEPDIRQFKDIQAKISAGQGISEEKAAKVMMNRTIMGRVWTWFQKLNPNRLPTLLFAPGVRESLWFAQQFVEHGITAAHIDGDDIWIDGEFFRSSSEKRAEIAHRSRSGDITVVCNRFVMREGINWPWLRHGVLATIFGEMQSYLQSGGRLLRADRDPATIEKFGPKEFCTIQDHGGNWHRFLSLNLDREWKLEFTAGIAREMLADNMRERKIREPFRCPQCGMIWGKASFCNVSNGGCGFAFPPGKTSRPVISTDGTLREITGDIYKPHRVFTRPSGPKRWEAVYWRARSKKWDATFRQAMAKFAEENYWQWPDRTWPLMPVEPLDFFRKVAAVEPHRLRGFCHHCNKCPCKCH